MCAMRYSEYECGGGGGVMRHGLRRAVLWPGVCGAVVYAVFIVVRRAEWWRARVSVSVFAYTCGRDRYDASASVQAYLTRAHTAQSYFLYAATHESFL